jgi:serine/threonine-protein kinase
MLFAACPQEVAVTKEIPVGSMPILSMLARAGNLVGGKYRLENVIGYGGMGAVWMATHIHLGQRVAIKIVSVAHSHSPEARQRFDLEAKAAARINSRHAVHVFDNGELDDGTPYIVMEYLEGESLDQRVRRDGPLSMQDCGRVLVHVSRALAAAHAMNLIHRDIKPENVFLTETPDEEGFVAKLLDFGIAKLLSLGSEDVSTTKTGSVMGTPLYMSPEQARGLKGLDHRTDLYSLGAVAFFMLTARQVFEAETMGEMVLHLCTARLPRISSFTPGVPESIENWFERACARDPDERFQDVQDMVAAYSEACGLAITGPMAARRASQVDFAALVQSGEFPHAPDSNRRQSEAPDSSRQALDPSLLLAATTGSDHLASGSALTVESGVPKTSRRSTFLIFGGLSLFGAAVLGLGIWIGMMRKSPSEHSLVAGSSRTLPLQDSVSAPAQPPESTSAIPAAVETAHPAHPDATASASNAPLSSPDLAKGKVPRTKSSAQSPSKGPAGGAVDLGF